MSSPINIRLARVEEHAALVALQVRASLANEGDRALLMERLDQITFPVEEIAAGQVVVAQAPDGRVLGFASALPREDGDVELDGLFVEPDAWKAGAGRALVAHVATHAKARGARAVHVVGNEHALGFYARCGFVEVGEEKTPFGPVAPRLKLAL